MKALILFTILGFASSCVNAVELKIITEKGYVAFTVNDDWQVIGMQTKPPVSVAGFQIPNTADDNTDDSANMAISIFHVEYHKAVEALKKVGQRYGSVDPKIEKFKDWAVYRQQVNQGETTYSILDAKKDVAGVAVGVRLAWPHLANNPPSYNSDMELTFHAVLDSIHGEIGPYKPKGGEVFRRPIK